MTNKEIAESIRKAAHLIKKETTSIEIMELCNQINSLTHYIKGEED